MATASDTYGEFCSATHPEGCVDRHPGRYLAAIYWLRSGPNHRVRTGEISDGLGVRPASVTEMLTRLADDSLVEYEKHHGVVLTNRGETVARELAWRQCTVRTFFASQLNTELDTHTAYQIGFTLSKHGITRLTELVDHRIKLSCCQTSPTENRCLFGTQTG